MYKDPTEFRQRFAAYKNGKKPYKNGRPEPILRIDSSESDFAQRLRSPWRQEIWDWEGSGKAATHKMSSADNIVYPNIQTTKGGGLIDFTHPMWEGVVDPLERAIRNKDYVPMKTEDDAIWTGPNYKKYYPGFKYGKESLPKFRLGTEGDDIEELIRKRLEQRSDNTTVQRQEPVLPVKRNFIAEAQRKHAAEAVGPDTRSLYQRKQSQAAKLYANQQYQKAKDDVKRAEGMELLMKTISPSTYVEAATGLDLGTAGKLITDAAAFGLPGLVKRGIKPIWNLAKNKLNTEGLLDNAIQQAKKFNDVFEEDTYARWILNGLNIPEFKYIWHGRGTNRGIPEHVLRPYSDKDAGLHVTESKKVALKFAGENGVVYSGIDTGLYPDAIYPDITNWTAREWESFLQPSKGYSRMDILKSMDEPYLSPAGKFSLEQELAMRDIADNFKLSLDEINNHARRKLFAGNNKADNELANKLFIDYLRDKGVLLRYKNAYEGGGYKLPSAFVTDMNLIWWDKQKFIKPKSKKQELIESMSDPKLSWAFYKQ